LQLFELILFGMELRLKSSQDSNINTRVVQPNYVFAFANNVDDAKDWYFSPPEYLHNSKLILFISAEIQGKQSVHVFVGCYSCQIISPYISNTDINTDVIEAVDIMSFIPLSSTLTLDAFNKF